MKAHNIYTAMHSVKSTVSPGNVCISSVSLILDRTHCGGVLPLFP